MGRPPSNDCPAFRFIPTEVVEMETVLQEHHNQMPVREILVSLAEKFRRYAIRAKSSKVPGKLNITSMPRDDLDLVRNVPQPATAPMPAPMTAPMSSAMPASTGRMNSGSLFKVLKASFHFPKFGVTNRMLHSPHSYLCEILKKNVMGQILSRHMSESYMEFEAKSSRDGAWYDVATFLAHRYLDSVDPEVLVRFAGFGPEEDVWVNIRKHVRQRSLPCEATECVAVLPGDLILCFQVKTRLFTLMPHVLDAQRQRHDVRGCCCRFLVRYDHDQSEVAATACSINSTLTNQQKTSTDPSSAIAFAPKVISSPTETMQKPQSQDPSRTAPVSHANVSVAVQTTNPESKNAGTIEYQCNQSSSHQSWDFPQWWHCYWSKHAGRKVIGLETDVQLGVKPRPISEFLMKVGSIRCYVSSCRAVLLPRFGGSEVLELRPDVPVPDLKPNELPSGYGRSIFEPLLPLILGRGISGEVADIGPSVKSLTVGQEVFGALHPTVVRGTYADYAILSGDELSPKPASVIHVEASAIPFAALTAWRALKSTARITEGQRLLVMGGGGAVGFAAIQLAVAAGCHVTTSCGNQSINQVMAAAAEQAVDYTAEDIEAVIKGKFDAVLDTIGVPETERIGINLLNRGGHYMTLQGEAATLSDRFGLLIGLPVATAVLLKKSIQYQYSHGIEYSWTNMRADSEGLH
ncbi:hypothetical protein CRYUN_Cryun25bG0032000 [Craigia yunnanensis]